MGMFANAKSIGADKPKGKKKNVDAVQTEGLHLYAALKAVSKNVEAQIAVVETELKNEMMEHFIEEGMKIGRKPESYTGVEDGSEGSMQIRTRVSTSALSPEAIKLFKTHNIPTTENVAREEAFIINPAYTNDMDMLAKVEKALSKLNLPADFIQKQEKSYKTVVDDSSIDAICNLKDEATVAALLPMATTLAIRAKLAPNADPFKVVDDAMAAAKEAAE